MNNLDRQFFPNGVLKNRHVRRLENRQKRVKPTLQLGASYWFKRLIIEMKQSKKIQDKIAEGKFDAYLS